MNSNELKTINNAFLIYQTLIIQLHERFRHLLLLIHLHYGQFLENRHLYLHEGYKYRGSKIHRSKYWWFDNVHDIVEIQGTTMSRMLLLVR